MSSGISGTQADQSELERKYLLNQENFQPWVQHSDAVEREQLEFQDILRRRAGAKVFCVNCFISPDAMVFTSHFEIGDNSWIAAGAIIRGHIIIGSNCSVNPFAHIAGDVKIGDGVRIAGLVSIYGFNHGFSRVDIPIYSQALTQKGVRIADGVWIGANAAIIDGVKIGEHSIVAAGAVVTKDIPEYSIVAGNPAILIRDRRAPAKSNT